MKKILKMARSGWLAILVTTTWLVPGSAAMADTNVDAAKSMGEKSAIDMPADSARVAGATGFKCSPRTMRCNCKGEKDCKYLSDSIEACKLTCTGSGKKKKCDCQLPGSL